ncbi:hypothetical protein HU200_057611 [Digitaria exilis]|uniref:Uncharacterized protein n=1 Tax=Digitaria exilis TaxID=1010633 RepID=A0A835AH71_9POAL|nr:hypothetical protein HU200_057611 [Digitaria exilis]
MNAAAAAEDVAAVSAMSDDFFFIDSFNLDFDFDFDLAADEFSVAEAGSKSSSSAVTGGESEGSSSPDSGVTDGPLVAEGRRSMMTRSGYMCELERFLLENDDIGIGDDVPAPCPGCEEGEELISVDDYFDDLMAVFDDGDGGVVADDASGTWNNGDDGESLAALEDDEPASRKRARYE